MIIEAYRRGLGLDTPTTRIDQGDIKCILIALSQLGFDVVKHTQTNVAVNDAITYKEFSDKDMPDGHYAVWKSAMIPTTHLKDSSGILGNYVYGFSGAIIEYSQREGFVGDDYPDWIDDTDEADLKMLLLEEIPTKEEFFD